MVIIPANFRDFMVELHAEEGERWLARLPQIIERCARRWQLEILPPFDNLSYSYVMPVVRADGSGAVLKIYSPTDEEEQLFVRSIEVLSHYDGHGIARMLAYDEQDEALLLERLEPGTLLSKLVPERDEEATSHFAAVLKQMLRPAPAVHGLLTVEEEMAGLAKLRPYYHGSTGPFPAELVALAEGFARELSASTRERFVLHGDLHHDNILFSEQRGWCAIDAKGLIGDAAYDPSAMFYNPQPQIFQSANPRRLLERRLDQLTDELGFERERLRGWGIAKAVLSAWWDVEGQGYISDFGLMTLECAALMAQMKG